MLNGRLMLALARRDPEPVIEALRDTPELPAGAQWATFLRNHDEIDLSRLTAEQRQEVFDQFGPDRGAFHKPEFLFDAPENSEHLIDHKGLADIVERTVVNSVGRRFHRTMSGHDDDLRIRIDRLHTFQQVKTGIVAKVDIADKNVGCGRYEFAKCFGSGRSLSYRRAELLQRVGDHFSCIGFIFNQEHSNILER